MRVLVCGGRNYADRDRVFDTLDFIHSEMPITCIIEGGARGADRLGREWAQARSVKVETFEADWNRYGKDAGRRRNTQMAEEGKPDSVIAFPGKHGTALMIRIAEGRNIPVMVVE